MCGICGQYNYLDDRPVQDMPLRRMAQAVAHRGPDDTGFFLSGPIGLGFRRLSIIDLDGGHQPMSDREQTVWVVFNGEIYNFPELRRELESLGHVFRTRSDTEVIIHGYRQWGADVLEHLSGMFGLALWDTKAKRLIVARDAMGIKLVYYRIHKGSLLFGSEIGALAAATGLKPEVDPVALNLFLRYRYTPSPLTLFAGVRKLAPGTMLIAENGQVRHKRWYRFTPKPFSPMKSAAEAGEELLALYKKAVRRHLLSDVPVGLLLSGGMDSGLLLGLMQLEGPSFPTYTVGYGDSFRDDELADAAQTARLFSAPNNPVQLDQSSFEAELPKIVACLEEPVASSSIVPMYFVCRRARQDVKVALIGQGPDELFGGYTRHLGVRYGSCWRRLPGWLRRPVTGAINALPRNEALKRGAASLGETDRLRRYRDVFSLVEGSVVDGLFHDGLLHEAPGERILDCWNGLSACMGHIDELGGFQLLELRSSLPDELLMYADKLSMAHGLEARVPYLDRDIVEYVQRLSASLKVRNGTTKWLHRRVCREFLPKEIVQRKKRGFAVNVVDSWFQKSLSGQMDGWLRDGSSLMFAHLRQDKVEKLLTEHLQGSKDNHKILFSLVVFEQWLRCAGQGGSEAADSLTAGVQTTALPHCA